GNPSPIAPSTVETPAATGGFPDELLVPASGSLAPLAEGLEGDDVGHSKEGWGRWVKGQLSRAPSASCRGSDLRFLLGVMRAPLAPVHVAPTDSLPPLSIKDTPISLVGLSSGRLRCHGPCGSKVHAGCNGKLVWRHTPWLGAHAATGPVRPPCVEHCSCRSNLIYSISYHLNPQTLKARSEGSVEIIRHVLFGYFGQKTGLLTCMEDSHLTRIQSSAGGDAVYWETTINSRISDYHPVDGTMIAAHSGHSVVTLFRFGEVAMSHTKTRMEEVWNIEEVAFNVPGLSMDCFIPPADVKYGSVSEAHELPQAQRGRSTMAGSHRARVAALEKSQDVSDDNIPWRVEV
ncbi:hypothetical protein BHE74_00031354, partial [Ensete ventricosum]